MKTYYTKCGKEFQKSSTAGVTGFTIDLENAECANCPFQVEVTKGYPPEHDRWECRAGSQPPNKKNEWSGSLEDKNTIQFKSLDNNLLEDALEYCTNHPDLAAAYNQDLEDCRRVLSISCSPNKKGMAAKKQVVDKFFTYEGPVCEECKHSFDEGESVEYIKCSKKKGFVTKKQQACSKFEKYEFFKEGDETVNCKIKECGFNNESGGCGFDDSDVRNSMFEQYANEAIELHCKNQKLMSAFADYKKKKALGVKIGSLLPTHKLCPNEKEDCGYFCKHNGGCALLLTGEKALKVITEDIGEVDCYVYRMEVKPLEKKNEEIAVVSNDVQEFVQEFDYSSVDNDTAEFLQDKATKISEIRFKSILAIGKELKEAHEKLANNKTGTFGIWVESLGMSRRTAENYIQSFNYITKNFRNIEDAENIQPSLLFAVSKPSAPAEAQKAVLEGDITTHKQYKELEAKLKAEQQAREEAEKKAIQEANSHRTISESYDRLEAVNSRHYKKTVELEEKIKLMEAEKTVDPKILEEIERLKKEKADLVIKSSDLEQQLRAKPIEIPAVREVVPEEIKKVTIDKVTKLLNDFLRLTETEYHIFMQYGLDNMSDALDLLDDVLSTVKSYRDKIAGDTKTLNRCGSCNYADMDGVSEDELEGNKTFCKKHLITVDFDYCCQSFKSL